MREIKFRVYIPQYLGMKGYFVYGLLVRKIDDACTILSNDKFYAVPCETVEQFTGLHDKNGVEIYEGDIVRYTESYGWSNQEGEVLESQVEIYPTYTYPFSNVVVCEDDFYNIEHSEYEVIGNIHEEVVK